MKLPAVCRLLIVAVPDDYSIISASTTNLFEFRNFIPPELPELCQA